MELYHLSEDNNLTVLTPKIPECATSIYENISTPRVCFGKSISGCLSALQDLPNTKYYVYTPIENIDTITPSIEQVSDAKATGEVWTLNPVKVKCIGIIQSYDYSIIRMHAGVQDKYGDDSIGVFIYSWDWIERF